MSIHDPVGSRQTNGINIQSNGSVESEAERLHSVKVGIELQLDAYFSQLEANNCDMQTSLIDPEGFPRSDIDVATVRTARAQIIRLRNDLKATMDQMALLLERGLPATTPRPQEQRNRDLKPFARVREVVDGSPAAHAGMCTDDEIIHFGVINETNHANLQALASLVQRSEGASPAQPRLAA